MTLLAMIGPTELILVLVILVFALLLPLLALVDILKSKFEGNNKLIWVLVVILLPILGTILYFLIGRSQRI